jgi:uncharacterized protein
MEFAPFENRLCRDIRNLLSKNFIEALVENRMDIVSQTALALKDKPLSPWHIDYIDNRLARYQIVLTQLKSDPEIFTTACLIWDQSLFFECHEWLEPFWIRAEGNEKKLIQALIRAAATYLLLEAKRTSGARKTAEKALAFLRVNQSAIPPIFKPDLLISALKHLESPPPKFMPTR